MKKLYNKLIIYFVCLMVLSIVLLAFNKLSFGNIALSNFILDSNITYQVKQNDGTLANSKLFVSNLVDTISVNFNEKYTLDKKNDLKYRYEIISYVISNVDDNTLDETEVFKKEELLKKSNIISSEMDNILIDETIKLNYNHYNDIATEYDEKVNLAIKSRLLVDLNLYVTFENGQEEKYTNSISLPLEKPTFSITKNENNSKGSITGDNSYKLIVNAVILLAIIVIVCLIIYESTRINKYKKEHILEFKYKKIMQDYNNIVVPIKKLPKDEKLVSVNVLYFKSMIDVQKELHLPILCYEGDKFIVYLIINDKLAYVYFLNDSDEKI